MSLERLRIHQLLPKSRANGPGARVVVWVQGCSLGCPGCFNPLTHSTRCGRTVPVEAVVEEVLRLSDSVEGLSVSGGEPVQQLAPVTALLDGVRARSDLSTLLFTGYTWRELERMPGASPLLDSVDVVLAGRYDASRRLAAGLLGSANKTVHFLTDRYKPEDLRGIPAAEVTISASGDVVATGIDPVILGSVPPEGGQRNIPRLRHDHDL